MKFGYRKPSIKKSIKARTTGKIKRKAKKAINPLYGKKGMGFVNNPKKAVYNKIYNKTTVDATKPLKKKNKQHIRTKNDTYSVNVKVVDTSTKDKQELIREKIKLSPLQGKISTIIAYIVVIAVVGFILLLIIYFFIGVIQGIIEEVKWLKIQNKK